MKTKENEKLQYSCSFSLIRCSQVYIACFLSSVSQLPVLDLKSRGEIWAIVRPNFANDFNGGRNSSQIFIIGLSVLLDKSPPSLSLICMRTVKKIAKDCFVS